MRVYGLLLLSCHLLNLYAAEEEPVVNTDLGKYRGHYMKTFDGRLVAAFNGIRYAKIPKRFQEAEKVTKHDGVFDATKDGNDCLQINHNYNQYPFEEKMNEIVGSEDCLFLNVYTPNVNPAKKYPVMVWIHGGGFLIGSGASTLHGPELLLDKDVVLVALNYRLGPFGFLSYDDDIIPGNIGLKDQSLALHWIKENVKSFGGDPESITIFGESAGGVAVHLQMHSPLNKGIIDRGISQSGSVDCLWAMSSRDKLKSLTQRFANFLGCTSTKPTELLTCLQEKSSDEIMSATASLKRMKEKMEMIFKPVFETKDTGFIREKDMMTRSKIPWMTGVNSGEGLIIYSEMIHAGDRNFSTFNSNYRQILPEFLNYEDHPQADKITSLIKNHYMGDAEFSVKNVIPFTNMFSDGLFIHGQLKSLIKHEGDTYLYLFTHQGERSLSTFTQIHNLGAGVQHGDDLLYLFPMKKFYPNLTFNDEDLKVAKLFVELWTNFAIRGNPTPDRTKPQWYESENGKLYVTISADGIELSKHLYATRMNFWDHLFTDLIDEKDTKDEL